MARKDLTPVQSQADVNEPTGWVNKAATTLSYVSATRTMTLGIPGAATDYYSGGKRFTLAGSQNISLSHANSTGLHYYYFDGSSASLQVSTTVWDIGSTTVPVAAVYFNATTGLGVCLDERHGAQMDGQTHKYLHQTVGTRVVSGFAISGYTLSPGAPTDAANDFDVAAGVVADEDLQTSIGALAAGASAYRVWYRSGAAGDWTWDTTTLPFTVGTTYPQYNSSGTWAKTEMITGRWINMWVLAVPSIDTAQDTIVVMGQVSHTSLANAQAEAWSSLALGTLPFTEMAPLYRVTYRTLSTYTSTGKCRIESVTNIQNTTTPTTLPSQDHGSLTGLTNAGAHPATAISVDTTNFAGILTTAETDVQLALDKIDDHTHAAAAGATDWNTAFMLGGM